MKTIITPRYQIFIATHTGMCFGVRQAIEASQAALKDQPSTILGQLAHNPTVTAQLASLGAQSANLDDPKAPTHQVIITAHGASERDRNRWHNQGHQVIDTTCPLVKVAHTKLAQLVTQGFQPVIIGKNGHVEVRGLQGDFPHALVILHPDDISQIPETQKIGIISQTTQPIDLVRALVAEVRRQRPHAEVRFQDTVCHPTKDRQTALHHLCQNVELVFAIGGKNSNNTAQLAQTARRLGCRAYHIESPTEIQDEWLKGITKIGLAAGTSTLDESLHAVAQDLKDRALQIPA